MRCRAVLFIFGTAIFKGGPYARAQLLREQPFWQVERLLSFIGGSEKGGTLVTLAGHYIYSARVLFVVLFHKKSANTLF